MKVHHLNCGTMRPHGGRLAGGKGGPFRRAKLVCHCLLVEARSGLVLVDTGLGIRDVTEPDTALSLLFRRFASPRLDRAETAVEQILRLGFSPEDVRDVVLTHLDIDHTGGLPDFPRARIHVHAVEHEAAMRPRTLLERWRYHADHWAHGPRWTLHETGGDRWHGFEAVRALPEADDEILLLPLAGHTRGHCGVAVRTSGRWLFHAGDAYFHHRQIDRNPPRCPVGLDLFQRVLQVDRTARLSNEASLRRLAKNPASGVRLFCAHDPWEFSKMREGR